MKLRLSALGALLFSLFLAATPSFAQPKLVEIGFKVGTPLNDLVDAPENKTAPLSVGGVLELNLPVGFAIEGNALYKRLGYRATDDTFPGIRIYDTRFNSWEFPILLKSYPLGRNPVIQPFLSAGVNFRTTGGEFIGLGGDQRVTNAGFVLGAGLRNGPGRIKIAPELRYTRWNDSTRVLAGFTDISARLNANQLEVLVGITF
jgi:hypothetical protein